MSLNSTDFTVADGAVSLANKETYLSISPSAFRPDNPDIDQVAITRTRARADANSVGFTAPINLPNGAVVTAAIVWGNPAAEAETWFLSKKSISGGAAAVNLAQANIFVEDTSISAPTIDNETAAYAFNTNLDINDEIWGARITYTTDYD